MKNAGRKAIGFFLLSAAFLTLPPRLGAVMVCYDYVYYRLTGNDPDPKGGSGRYLDREAVERYLTANHYKPMLSQVHGNQLQAGDVIFLNGHVGYANGPDNIDHFIQLQGTSRDPNAVYNADRLPKHEVLAGLDGGFFRGGLYRGESLDVFLSRPYRPTSGYVVWRRGGHNEQLFVYLLTNASNGLYLGTASDLDGKLRCDFEGGGRGCQPSDVVRYEAKLGPFTELKQARSAFCKAITQRRVFPLNVGLKGRWQGTDTWYGLWDSTVKFDCSGY